MPRSILSLLQQQEEKIQPPIPLRPDETVIQDLTCTVCREIAFNHPVITPCEHVFCKPCIQQTIITQGGGECPNDRHPLSAKQLRPLNGMLRRIWEKLPVKCPNKSSCTWSGTLGNYMKHAYRCSNSSSPSCSLEVETLRESVVELEQEVAILRIENSELESQRTKLWQKIEALEVCQAQRIEELEKSLHDLQELFHWTNRLNNSASTATATTSNNNATVDPLYKYDQYRVIELAQLICMHLEHKPNEIDQNRIYNCVKYCYDRLDADDTPSWTYPIDVRLLLNICIASTWFTHNQQKSFRKWCQEQWDEYH